LLSECIIKKYNCKNFFKKLIIFFFLLAAAVVVGNFVLAQEIGTGYVEDIGFQAPANSRADLRHRTAIRRSEGRSAAGR